jgi:hypothetical protein
MGFYLLKIIITALLVTVVSELAGRNNPFAALLAALPLISILAMIWMHLQGSPAGDIALLSKQIFWLVLPSLVLFLLFPVLIKLDFGFWLSLGLASGATILSYGGLLWFLKLTGVWV